MFLVDTDYALLKCALCLQIVFVFVHDFVEKILKENKPIKGQKFVWVKERSLKIK